MPFIPIENLDEMELFPGTTSRLIAGEKIMLSILNMAEGSVVPDHSHPHEQAGFVIEGKLKFRIGDEEKVVGPGEAFVVPSNVVHSVIVLENSKVIDIFSPPREDYQNRYNNFTKTNKETIWQ